MPRIEVPQPRALPTTAITDTRRMLPPGLFEEQFAAGQGLASGIGQLGGVLGVAGIRKTAQEKAQAEEEARLKEKARQDTLKAQEKEEYAVANLGYATALRQFKAELLTDTNYAGYTEKFDAWHDTTSAELIKQINHPEAITRAKLKFDTLRATGGTSIDALAQQSLVRQTRTLLPDKIEDFVTEELQADTEETLQTAVDERQEYFQMLIDTGVLNVAEAQAIERQYQEAKAERVLENTVTGIAVEEGWDEALKFLNDTQEVKRLVEDFGVELADIDRILEDIRTQARLSRAEGKAVLENERKDDRQKILNKLIATDFTDMADFVNDTSLTPGEKLQWIEKSESRAEAINKAKKDPFEQTHNPTYFALRRKIQLDPDSVTEEDLAELVGKGDKLKFTLPTPEQQRKDARTGELGQVGNSSEISITVIDPRLNNGKPTNIPTLVKGQIDVEELAITFEWTREQEQIAIERAAERVAAGATLPSFETIELAVKAAGERSKTKDAGGISIPDYEKLLKMITDEDDPLNDPSSIRAQAIIGNLRTQEIAILKTPRKEKDLPKVRAIQVKYLRISNEHDAYLLSEEGRKATDKQKEDKLFASLGPTRDEITLNWFQRLVRTEKREEAALVDKKIDALKEEGFWKDLTDEDKAMIRRRLERGDTVENIIRLAR